MASSIPHSDLRVYAQKARELAADIVAAKVTPGRGYYSKTDGNPGGCRKPVCALGWLDVYANGEFPPAELSNGRTQWAVDNMCRYAGKGLNNAIRDAVNDVIKANDNESLLATAGALNKLADTLDHYA